MPQVIDWSLVIGFLLLLACAYYLQIGIVTLRANKGSKMRQAFMSACVFLSIWSGCYSIMTVVNSLSHAKVFWAIGYMSSLMIITSLLQLVNELVSKELKYDSKRIYFIYGIALVVGAVGVFSNDVAIAETAYGNEFYFKDFSWGKYTFIYIIGVAVIVFRLLIKWYRASTLKRDKMLARTFLMNVYMLCPQALYFDFIRPILYNKPIVPISSLLILIVSMRLFQSIDELSSFSITVKNAADKIFKAVGMPLFILNERDEIVIASDAAKGFFSSEENSLIGLNILKLITLDNKPPDYSLLAHDFTDILIEADEGRKICSMTLTIDYDKYGDILHKVAVLRDITAMQQALQNAREASRAKTDFLSRMSHEIRTPMNAIIGMAKIGQDSNNIDRTRYCLDKISDASTHLLGIINDILDMSKIEADKLDITYNPFSLQEMIEGVCEVVSIKALEKHIDFIVDIDPDIPKSVIGDELRISQVITNLLSNALKFTPEYGTVELIACVKNRTGKGESIIHVEVRDTGIGITKEQQERLFTSFEQADGSIARRFGGTGLGLAISKRIADLMGGELYVTSEDGEGSTFHFDIKLKHTSEKGKYNYDPNSFKKVKVLVVDDAPEIRAFFDRFFTRIGVTYNIAQDGFEAIKLVKEADEEKAPYNILFVDYLMQELNGVQTVMRIREYIDESVPIIMVSVYEWSIIEKEAMAAGITRYLQKPLFSSCIFNIINEVANAGEYSDSYKNSAIKSVTLDFSHNTILIAEDIEINREIVISLLETTGVIIECAEDGQQAIDMFKSAQSKYDLILMDIQMPMVDGLNATRAIRSLDNEFAKKIPIVAMTANAFKEDVDTCLMAGMNDHIGKPIDINELTSKLSKYLPNK